ncbi:MAG TPA: glycosyltransferase family 39 protein [Acidobacteriaceae bacterium]|jgi:hypothetical protein|nr:glycosyltransferase family 39 protein [Acidobacteriaceae bacterium]
MTLKADPASAPGKSGGQRRARAALFAIAGGVVVLHLLTNGRYGFHRDELQFLTDARHLEWGFVAYPPLDPFVERVSMAVFGLSMVGLRLASVIAQAMAIVLTGMMAKEVGGGRLAQVAAALAVALAPATLGNGTEFQYTSFDFLWWVLLAYCVIRLLRSENPRWWLAIGTVAGVGLMTKYSILFFIAGVLGGFVLTRARRLLASWYFAAALAITVLIVLPNLMWQAHHGWISYRFLHSIHVRDVGEGRADGFLVQQLWLCTDLFSAPLWVAGLVVAFWDRRWRAVGWMYVIPLALFFFGKGRGYYMGPAYPMLMAVGAVAGERWVGSLTKVWRRVVTIAFFGGVTECGVLMVAAIVPLAGSGPLMRFAMKNNGDLREETGWPQIVQAVAGIRNSLPPGERAQTGILVGNYGEAGAVEILGPQYGLPAPISGINTAWYRGYPSPPPTTLIVLGLSEKYADRILSGCRVAAHVVNPYGVENEESRDHPDILVCGGPRQGWAEFWQDFQHFG